MADAVKIAPTDEAYSYSCHITEAERFLAAICAVLLSAFDSDSIAGGRDALGVFGPDWKPLTIVAGVLTVAGVAVILS